VSQNSKAAKAGLKEGDLILTASSKKVLNLMTFRKILETEGNKKIVLGVVRDQQNITISVEKEK